MDRVNASAARAMLPEILDRVEAGEEITILRHGKPVAVVVSPASVAARRASAAIARAAEVRDAIERARRTPLPSVGLSNGRADALVAEIEAARARC